MKNSKKRDKSPKLFTRGYMNRIIDNALHPFFKNHEGLIWLDGLLHAAIEQDPQLSIEKFVRYNVPTLMKMKRTSKEKTRTTV